MKILYVTSKLALSSRGALLVLLLVTAVSFALACFNSGTHIGGIFFVIAAVVLMGLIAIFGTEKHKVIKATLSDDYSVYSLFDEYEVVGREGDIWILEEKK